MVVPDSMQLFRDVEKDKTFTTSFKVRNFHSLHLTGLIPAHVPSQCPQNRLWLRGGTGPDISGFEQGSMNDLWMYSNDVWTWMSGSNECWQVGTYGTKGIAEPANAPGTRTDASGWVDDSDHLWLFGGDEFDSVGQSKLLNDLWMY
jgi:hypothetical protein